MGVGCASCGHSRPPTCDTRGSEGSKVPSEWFRLANATLGKARDDAAWFPSLVSTGEGRAVVVMHNYAGVPEDPVQRLLEVRGFGRRACFRAHGIMR